MSDPIYICRPMIDGVNHDFSLWYFPLGLAFILFLAYAHIPFGWLMWGVSWIIWRIVEFKQKLSKR